MFTFEKVVLVMDRQDRRIARLLYRHGREHCGQEIYQVRHKLRNFCMVSAKDIVDSKELTCAATT